jgi:hypothetical protein
VRSVRCLALAAILLSPAMATGQGPDLDRLLKLPDSVEFTSEKKAGATRSEWRQRFSEAREAVGDAETELEKAQAELAKVAGSKSEWQMAPPGLPAQPSEDSSSSFQLRQTVKRQRAELDRARARLRELEVEANLAGVPEEWRQSSTDTRSSDRSGDDSATAPAATR